MLPKRSVGDPLSTRSPTLEISDIQAIVLRPRPSPYRGEYVILRVDDAAQGREMVRRMIPRVAPADENALRVSNAFEQLLDAAS
jgi:hypothetical protein